MTPFVPFLILCCAYIAGGLLLGAVCATASAIEVVQNWWRAWM